MISFDVDIDNEQVSYDFKVLTEFHTVLTGNIYMNFQDDTTGEWAWSARTSEKMYRRAPSGHARSKKRALKDATNELLEYANKYYVEVIKAVADD